MQDLGKDPTKQEELSRNQPVNLETGFASTRDKIRVFS